MSTAVYNRDSLAAFYAHEHLKTDVAVKKVIYLPQNSPELVPIDFGIDMGQSSSHSLLVVDVTPEEWDAIEKKELAIPDEWSLEEMREFK